MHWAWRWRSTWSCWKAEWWRRIEPSGQPSSSKREVGVPASQKWQDIDRSGANIVNPASACATLQCIEYIHYWPNYFGMWKLKYCILDYTSLVALEYWNTGIHGMVWNLRFAHRSPQYQVWPHQLHLNLAHSKLLYYAWRDTVELLSVHTKSLQPGRQLMVKSISKSIVVLSSLE